MSGKQRTDKGNKENLWRAEHQMQVQISSSFPLFRTRSPEAAVFSIASYQSYKRFEEQSLSRLLRLGFRVQMAALGLAAGLLGRIPCCQHAGQSAQWRCESL